MTNLANNLTFYRKKNGLTQGQLGELLHVSAQAISKWENGQAEPSLDIILKLAEIYHISTDELLSSAQAESAETVTAAPAAQQEKKPSGFAKFLRKFWYIPVILLLLIGVAIGVTSYLNAPARYGRMIKKGDITIGMTESEIKELLGKPTDTCSTKSEDFSIFPLSDLNYDEATYYTYYDERDAKTDDELWFGVEYKFLRLVFNKDGILIEAYYCNTPSTDVFSYTDAEYLTVTSYERVLYENGRATKNGIVEFDDGSVYLGVASHPKEGSSSTGTVTTDKTKIEIAMGVYSLPTEEDSDDKTADKSDKASTAVSGKTCYICGEKKTDCKNDTRVLGEDEPVPVCKDCRKELDLLL